ncbi:MAG: flippase-like domain-containing protein, partial [Planctomycetaceae bacterium]|nr:flippase-like domain-containing protein [Planctomycetaceae bacterium]
VIHRAVQLWQEQEQNQDWNQIPFHPGWLVLAGLFYLVGWLPSVWFWRTMIRRVGGRVRFDDAARAYYCGHLGKYVPGKATVLVIRSALLKDRGAPISVSVLTVTCETLMMMSTGIAVAVSLLPWLVSTEQTAEWPSWAQEILKFPWLPGVIVVTSCLILSPIIASLLTLLAVKFTPKGMMGGESRVRITSQLVIQGLLAFTVSWMLHGLSLGFTLRSVSDSVSWSQWPVWTGAVAGGTSVGFAAIFAPGGLGVRELLLLTVLEAQPSIKGPQAAVVPFLFRVVSFVSEICMAVVLYYFVRGKAPNLNNPAAQQTTSPEKTHSDSSSA